MENRVRLCSPLKGGNADHVQVIDEKLTIVALIIDVKRRQLMMQSFLNMSEYLATKNNLLTITVGDKSRLFHLAQDGKPYKIQRDEKIYTVSVESIGMTTEAQSRPYCDLVISW
jgi:hypothetical protein